MLLEALLDVLLRISDILFARLETGGFVHNDRASATASIGAGLFVATVAIEIFEIEGS